MKFLYSKEAGNDVVFVQDEALMHLKIRRIKPKKSINLRNLEDEFLYEYQVDEINKKFISLSLVSKAKQKYEKSNLSLALAMIDSKILEKTLPFLNEMGLDKLILVYSDFSQKNFKLDEKRCEKILINSSQQCGRDNLMQIELFKDVESFCKKYDNVILLDFETDELLDEKNLKDEIIFVGCEGGFSKKEREFFTRKVKFKSPYTLKSQSAIIGLCAKILL